MDLNGKIAIVTGAGRGIGRAIAEKMAEYGAKVVVADLAVDTVARVADELTQDGHEAEAIAVDVTRASSVDRMVRGTVARFGQVDTLVNNAGIYAAPGWEDRNRPNDRDWDMIYSVNVKGVSKATDAAVRQMRRRQYGKIINIASVAGRQGGTDNPPYNVSKAGVISLTQAYALELASDNINVNAICPGLLWTPMWSALQNAGSEWMSQWAGFHHGGRLIGLSASAYPWAVNRHRRILEIWPCSLRPIFQKTSQDRPST
mgnify:CR=1 FL=1